MSQSLLDTYLTITYDELLPFKTSIYKYAVKYLSHEFNLLGSNWTEVKYHNYKDYPFNQVSELNDNAQDDFKSLWSQLPEDYQPIDWQLDFKSGYRWDINIPSTEIQFGHIPRVDVKVPWELSRMQHLPTIAFAYLLSIHEESNSNSSLKYWYEFKHQIIDFIASNPVNYGVNWRCTMDCSLRVVSWLVAYDIFRLAGIHDEEFENILLLSLRQHLNFIKSNIEFRRIVNNHFLTNLCGLIFLCAYLPQSEKLSYILSFGVSHLICQVDRQFNPDGSNFEASTTYHCLSSEMVAWSTILIMALPEEKKEGIYNTDLLRYQEIKQLEPVALSKYYYKGVNGPIPFSSSYCLRLANAAQFIHDCTKPNGRLVQIGDNDSGRFLKLDFKNNNLADSKSATFEDLLNYESIFELLLSINGESNHLNHLSSIISVNILKNQSIDMESITKKNCEDISSEISIEKKMKELYHYQSYSNTKKTEIPIPECLLESINHVYYPDFGIYIYKNYNFFLSIRCGNLNQELDGGHAHCDQLAIELYINGEEWITDPGSFCYTSDSVQRNIYRSFSAHFAPHLELPSSYYFNNDLFCIIPDLSGQCIYHDSSTFLGCYKIKNIYIYRKLQIHPNQIIILDSLVGEHDKAHFNTPYKETNVRISSGYGIVEKGDFVHPKLKQCLRSGRKYYSNS